MNGRDELSIEDAFLVFGRSFTFLRNTVFPSEMVRAGGLYAIQDVQPRKQDPRAAQFFAVDRPPEEVLSDLAAHGRGRYFLCVLVAPEGSLEASKAAYKKAGFRLMTHEPMFTRPLVRQPIQQPESPFFVQRVETIEDMDAVTRGARSRQIRREDLGVDDAAIRLYCVHGQDGVIGWVRSVRTGRDAYVSNLSVRQAFRRRGVATAMMSRLLADDQRLGVSFSVLLASIVGSKLYPSLGYRQIGTLQIFSPPRSK